MTYSTPKDAKWPDIPQMMLEGVHQKTVEDRVDTALKAGRFRGGSTGVVLESGEVAGVCVRAAAARFLGADPERDPAEWTHKQLMFEAGYTNEDSWFENLSRIWPGKVLREEEFDIKWEIDGFPGTGREDLILADAAGKAECLLELKLVCSLNTALDVLFRAKPKMEHAIQLGNYMLRSNLPGVICYTNRVDIAVPDWGFLRPHLPKSPADSDHHAAGYCQWSKGSKTKPPSVTKIKQFVVAYAFRWNSGVLEWRPLHARDASKWVATPIKAEGIDAFYRRVLQMISKRELAAPPAVVEIDGSKGHYDKCSYCDFNYLCSEAGDSYARWESVIKRLKQDADELAPQVETK